MVRIPCIETVGYLHVTTCLQCDEDVNDHHSAQLVSYIKFAKYQRAQCLKSVRAAVTDTKEVRATYITSVRCMCG